MLEYKQNLKLRLVKRQGKKEAKEWHLRTEMLCLVEAIKRLQEQTHEDIKDDL
jgi:hypothetical protein